MKKIILITSAFMICFMTMFAFAGSKSTGESCIGDSECAFGNECNDGVCVKKKEFDFGGSGKTGKPCHNDADCIGSGKCVSNSYGRSVCSGN